MSDIVRTIMSMDMPSDVNVETHIPGIRVFRGERHLPRQPVMYNPGLCILLQGRKTIFQGGVPFFYNADNYLVVSVNLPLEAETFGKPGIPVIGMSVDIDMGQLHELIAIVGNPTEPAEGLNQGQPRAVQPARLDPAMRKVLERMAGCLHSEMEARAIGPGLVRELLFRVLRGPQSTALHALVNHGGSFSRIAHVLRLIQTQYAQKMDVDYLAKEAHMGLSAFHHAFREVTADSPMQYLKKVRLSKARDLIMQEREKVYIAADSVGYESTSQFSREFKRYFGEPPSSLTRQAPPQGRG